ncbi:MAG TPA: hypothetical protein VHN99_12365 [Deinococcales bacterium]|nr:hypothetical protein [Deinococcales bacterium]
MRIKEGLTKAEAKKVAEKTRQTHHSVVIVAKPDGTFNVNAGGKKDK